LSIRCPNCGAGLSSPRCTHCDFVSSRLGSCAICGGDVFVDDKNRCLRCRALASPWSGRQREGMWVDGRYDRSAVKPDYSGYLLIPRIALFWLLVVWPAGLLAAGVMQLFGFEGHASEFEGAGALMLVPLATLWILFIWLLGAVQQWLARSLKRLVRPK
jgi:hypothetical protein